MPWGCCRRRRGPETETQKQPGEWTPKTATERREVGPAPARPRYLLVRGRQQAVDANGIPLPRTFGSADFGVDTEPSSPGPFHD
jgi:hypothetical protein